MSVKYALFQGLVKAFGLKKQWEEKNAEKLLERQRRKNAKNHIPRLSDPDFEISLVKVMGFPVLRLIHKKTSDRANLFLIGGGMISPPRPGSIKKALRFAKESDLDVFVPYYPLCTEYPVTKAYQMIHESYQMMLKSYAPSHISVLGSSSGGALALGMVPYINDGRYDVPMPGYIMAVSPGSCPDSTEEWKRMRELDKRDILIPAQYMRTVTEIMRCGRDDVPDYMIWLQRGDFTNGPKVSLLYGGDETLSACAPSLTERLKRCGVKCDLHIGKGMFHCYPFFPVCREARAGWDLVLRLMKENLSGSLSEPPRCAPSSSPCSSAPSDPSAGSKGEAPDH